MRWWRAPGLRSIKSKRPSVSSAQIILRFYCTVDHSGAAAGAISGAARDRDFVVTGKAAATASSHCQKKAVAQQPKRKIQTGEREDQDSMKLVIQHPAGHQRSPHPKIPLSFAFHQSQTKKSPAPLRGSSRPLPALGEAAGEDRCQFYPERSKNSLKLKVKAPPCQRGSLPKFATSFLPPTIGVVLV